MPQNEENIQLDIYSNPQFDPALLTQISVTEGLNYLDAPSNLDRLYIELIDEYDNVVNNVVGHISNLSGVKYSAGTLQIDTFQLVANTFGETSGMFSLKISGYRSYLYNDIDNEAAPVPSNIARPGSTINLVRTVGPEEVSPAAIQFTAGEVVELSRSRKEIRIKSNNESILSFIDFAQHQRHNTIPVGRYWKWEDNATVYYSATGEIDRLLSISFSNEEEYDAHRESLGLPFGPDNSARYSGNYVVDVDGKFLRWMVDTDEGSRLESDEDSWPLNLRFVKPNGSVVDLISVNWMEHAYTPKQIPGEEDPESIQTIIFKLATPAPAGINAGNRVQLLRSLFIPYTIPVEIDIPFQIDETFTELRGPNLRLEVNRNSSKGTITKNQEDLVRTTAGVQNRLEGMIISSSGLITTNTDFRKFENFVHFSSAEERLKNFKYKITRIEHYASKSAALGDRFVGNDGSVTGSATSIANKLQFDTLTKGLLTSFSPYEEYLYYTSHSTETVYTGNGTEILSSATWPKSSDTKTGIGYNLFSVTSSEGTSWYNDRLVSAKTWDVQNQSALRNIIPTHIRMDEQSTSYELFFDMIGEHFDQVYLQIQGLEESYRRDESVNAGLSKDLLFDTAKSFGWDLFPGHSTAELWEYALGTNDQGTYQASGSGTTQTYVVKESHSSEDIEKQTWKRILNNLPLLLKTKGTSRGIRALLTSYGVPLTILNIDEYGGAPASRTDDKRAIEKFTYALNLSGSNIIVSLHDNFQQGQGNSTANSLTTPGTALRAPSMYEVRVDTSKQQTQYIARAAAAYAGGKDWEVRMEHSSSATGWDTAAAISAGSASVYAQYGRFTFEISSSAGQPAISASTEYMPIYDNDWWNVSFGVTEHPYTGASAPASQSFVIRCAKAAEHSQGTITHQSSGTVVGNSSSYSATWSDIDTVLWGWKYTDSTPGFESYSGSFQEIRVWAEYLSDTAFHQHTLAPTSIVGDTVQMAYNDLLIRLPLGTDGKKYDHSSVTSLASTLPNAANQGWGNTGLGGTVGFTAFGSNDYSPKSETYFVKVPHTAGPSKHSNKVRIEDNTLQNNQLARDKSFEVSSFDSNPLDSEDVSVVLSPADQIDTDISMQFGGFDLDDYIGDPRDTYKTEYTSLRDTNNLYFKKYDEGNSVMAFIKYLRSFNKGLFKQIEDMIPARADAIVGIEIRPNLLERHKLSTPLSASQETLHLESSITLRTGSTLPGEVPSQGIQDASNYGTFTGTLGIGAPPSQQRSGSSNYYNLYDGATYLKNVFGEATESGEQLTVLNSRRVPHETRIQIPTYNTLNAPVIGTSKTGSGWITVFEDNFTSFVTHSATPGTPASSIYGTSDISEKWRIVSGTAERSIVGDGLQIGNNSGNDQLWMLWNSPLPYQPNTLYRMTVTVSQSLDASNDAFFFAGFGHFIDTYDNNPRTLQQYSPNTGTATISSANYFVASGLNIGSTHGLGKDVTRVGYLGNAQTRARTQNTNTATSTGISGIMQIKTPEKGVAVQHNFTHFTPTFLVNFLNDDGTMRITSMKVEALPGAFVDVQPQYDTSLAQRRLLIDGTKMTSPDFNVGSTDTIDGGPVAEYQLVNPNILQVTPVRGAGGPTSPLNRPANPAVGNIQQAQNNNINVR